MRNHLTAASVAALIVGLGGLAAAPVAQAQISIGINVNLAPPPLPIEEQPEIPGYGYIWTPGYWAWDGDYSSYYWVPGEWIQPPRVGLYWTPGYWGWNNGAFIFNSGYWGPTVGYYGGVDYGYGYGGRGFEGGEWRSGRLYYNRTVTNIGSRRIGTVFARPVAPLTRSRVSFAGGKGGLAVRPTPAELAASRAPHVKATPEQVRQAHAAGTNPTLRADKVAAKPKIEAGRTLPAKTPAGPAVKPGPAAAEHGAATTAADRPAKPAREARPARPDKPAASETMSRPAATTTTTRPEHRAVNRPAADRATPPMSEQPSRPMNERPGRPTAAPQPDRMSGMQRTAPTPMRAAPVRPQTAPANTPAREPAARPQRPAAKPDASKPDRKTPPE